MKNEINMQHLRVSDIYTKSVIYSNNFFTPLITSFKRNVNSITMNEEGRLSEPV